MKLKFSLLIILSCITACTVHPKYVKPTLETPENWQEKLAHGADVNQLRSWWSQFNDPALDTLTKASQHQNPTLEQSVASIKAARANIQLARGQRWPTLSGVLAAEERKSGNAGGSGTIESQRFSIDSRWELDILGKVGFAKDSAIANLEEKTFNWHDARVSLAAEVASTYVNYRACELKVAALQKAFQSKKETARITQISASAGFTAPADALLAKANASSSESAVIAQQAQCQLDIKSLVALSNLPENTLRKTLNTSTGLPNPAMFTVTTVPAQLILQRPDLRADERKLAAASADIGLAKTNLYPSISLAGSIGYQRTVFNGFGFKTNTWSFGPTLNLPIFDGGQNKANVTIKQENFNEALARYKQDVRNAVKEVEQALVNLNSATKREAIERVSNAQYADYFKAAEINWRAGGLDLLALEDARRQMINAETSLITQQQNRVLYWIALYKAFGGDWQSNKNALTKTQ